MTEGSLYIYRYIYIYIFGCLLVFFVENSQLLWCWANSLKASRPASLTNHPPKPRVGTWPALETSKTRCFKTRCPGWCLWSLVPTQPFPLWVGYNPITLDLCAAKVFRLAGIFADFRSSKNNGGGLQLLMLPESCISVTHLRFASSELFFLLHLGTPSGTSMEHRQSFKSLIVKGCCTGELSFLPSIVG